MNKMGKIGNAFEHWKSITKKIKSSYTYKLFSKIISFFATIILIFLLVLGAVMFYFNNKAKSYQEQGISYTPPFGLYTIISQSMQPNINVYDVVVTVEVSDLDSIKVGDVITFVSTWDLNYGKTVTHRVVSITKTETGEYQFVTKGDFNESADGAVVTQENLIGKVVMRIPQLGRIQFFLATKMGWFLVVFIPALIIVILDVIKIFKLVVLKGKIGNVSSVKDAEKIYYDGEILDGRSLNDDVLSKTLKLEAINNVEKPIIEVKKENNKGFIKLSDNSNKPKDTNPMNINHSPIKVRSNIDNSVTTGEGQNKKILAKRKKL